MSSTRKLPRTTLSFAVAFALTLVLTALTWASVASEQQEGAQLLSAVHSGKLKGTSLSRSQYEHVGEYLMGQALVSTASHQQMNSLMGAMVGSTAADQMHVYLGERYLGKSAQIPGRYAPMYGLIGMMTGYRGSSIASMMSGYLGSHGQSASPYTVGPGMMGYYQTSAKSSGGWSTGAIIATAAVAALLLAGALALALPRLRGRRRGDGHTPPTAS
jgi:heme/copper-type cytochrome/quinol oxidase subunit 4